MALLALVVEDNKLIQKVYSMALADLEYAVKVVGLGAQALTLLEANQYDVVLMNIRLPDKSGIEVTRAFRQSGRKNIYTPIIAMTTYLNNEIISNCLEAGCDLVLNKSISVEELKAYISAFATRKISC